MRGEFMKLEKCNSVNGTVVAVDSKSDAHRALICSALCNGQTKIKVKALNYDIIATATCLSSLGANVTREGDTYSVSGRAEGGGNLFCAESGSTARFLLPVAGALGGVTTFLGKGKLPQRPMLPLTEEMRKAGCTVSADFLPLTVSGRLKGGKYTLSGSVSSQFISGLLMALPLTNEPSEILLTSPLQSELYADMTVKTLKNFGVKWQKLSSEESGGFYGGYRLDGITDYSNFCTAVCAKATYDTYKSPEFYAVEGDWSGAAFFAVAAALAGKVELLGLDTKSLQPDKAIIDITEQVGASVTKNGDKITVEKRKINPFSLDVSQFPDLFPVLSVLACGAEGESLLFGAGRLRIKESDRIETTASMIRALGGKVEVGEDYLKIFGSGRLSGGKFDGAGDHRIVMSGAIASLISDGNVEIIGHTAVNKSYPEFFEVFEKIRG